MIPRLGQQHGMLSSHIEWPDNPSISWSDTSPFAPRAPLRKLRVVIDNELYKVAESPLVVTPEEILTGLLMHEYISCFRYADEGPPPEVKARTLEGWGEAYEGWVTVDPPDSQLDTRGLVFFQSDAPMLGTAYVDRDHSARSDTTAAYANVSADVAADKREADVLALQVARGIDADIFVTVRPYLYQAKLGSLAVKLLRPKEAIAIIGLYLRSQGIYTVFRNNDIDFSMGRDVYFSVGAIELLPAIWRWSDACAQESQISGNRALSELAGSLIQRVQRALEARDELHRVLNRAQGNETRTRILSNLDIVLLLLMAASDITARVAHYALGLGDKSYHGAGWQRSGWIKKVRARDESLAALVDEGTAALHMMKVLSTLRNSIHAEVLQTLLVRESSTLPITLFNVPTTQISEFTKMIDDLGGQAAWGLQEVRSGEFHADPGIFIDQLFAHMLDLLNTVMNYTPVGRLPNIKRRLLESPPEPRYALDRYSETNRNSIRWQLGL